MIFLIAGGSHTGKTVLAQRMLEAYRIPYLSIDHLKMGLIRSGLCPLTPESPDEELTAHLWPVVREIVKTNIENRQHLVVEGCYIPFGWQKDFAPEYAAQIRYVCLAFSDDYIRDHFSDIRAHACDIEDRQEDEWLTPEMMLEESRHNRLRCREYGLPVLLADGEYRIGPEYFADCFPQAEAAPQTGE